jgi:thiol-disulfide isomerase/thioredoxin
MGAWNPDHMNYNATLRFCLVIALIALIFASPSFAGRPLEVGAKAPDWILSNGNGQDISFYQDSADQPAVILFWATWCPYCAELMPELKTLQEQFKDTRVKFYALNVWEDGDAPSYMTKHGYDFTLLLNADMVAKRYSVKGTPGLLVVDKDKIVRYIRVKGTSAADAAAEVKAFLLKGVE